MNNIITVLSTGVMCIALTLPSYGAITFKKGWDSEEYSDVTYHTKSSATEYLRNHSDSLQGMIDASSKCMIEVTKSCHQPNDPHFTINGANSKSSCTLIYAGSRSIHIPCE